MNAKALRVLSFACWSGCVVAGGVASPLAAAEIFEPRSEQDSSSDKESGFSADTDGIHYRTEDNRLRWTLGGRLHLDGGAGQANGPALDETSFLAGRVRRARFELGVTVDRFWNFDAQVDAADRDRPIANLNIGYTGLSHAAFTFGNFQAPFSLENVMSSNDITFMERSLADIIVPRRNFGAAMSLDGERWTAAFAVVGGNINEGIADQGVAVQGRVTYTPLKEDDHVLHFGLSGSYRALDPAQEISFNAGPESRIYAASVLEVDPVRDARKLARAGLEFAYLNQAFRMQGEYVVAHAEQDGRRDSTFHAGYLMAAYVLTGQVQKYSLVPDKKRRDVGYAAFSGPELADKDCVSNGGTGAWEVAARYSILDLGGRDDGGQLQDVTLGLNWYPEKNVRIMGNYIHAFVDQYSSDRPRGDIDIVQARLQIAF